MAAPLSEVFSFLSGLYFRGKHAYATAFANPPAGLPGSLVITTNRGLLPATEPVTADEVGAVVRTLTVAFRLEQPRLARRGDTL